MSEATYVIRPVRPEDVSFVTTHYVRGAKRTLWASETDGITIDPLAERFVAACLSSEHVSVAAHPGSDVILGYCLHTRAGSRAIVHYLFVKNRFRKRGVGAALWRHATSDATQLVVTHLCQSWQRDKVRGLHRPPHRPCWVAPRRPWLWLLEYEHEQRVREEARRRAG